LDKLNIGSPEVEITSEVIQRLGFLLEIKPSTDYYASVCKIKSRRENFKRSVFKAGNLQTIAEGKQDDEVSALFSDH